MLFKNACIENSTQLQDFRVKDGFFKEIGNLTPAKGEEVRDLEGKLVLPPFIRLRRRKDGFC